MNKAYNRTYWENKPSDKSPINERNLNNIEVGVDEIDNRVLALDTTKFDKVEAQGLFKDVALNRANGVITFTMYNGATKTIDTLLEKIAVNFDYDPATQRLIITLDDGEIKYIDLSALITQYEFLDSDTVDFQIQADGKVTAVVKEGSIQEKHLRPDYLADIKVEAAKAQASQQAAAASEQAAAKSAEDAAISEQNASASEASAAVSAGIASDSAVAAKDSEDAAKISEENARASEEAAGVSEQNAATSAQEASVSAAGAADSAKAAAQKAGEALSSAQSANNSATEAESYAHGGTGTREGEDADNAMEYARQAKESADKAQEIAGGQFVPLSEKGANGGVATLDSSGKVPKVQLPEDIGSVTGVKGEAETAYRTGEVNLTPEDIGAVSKDGKAASALKADTLSATDKRNALKPSAAAGGGANVFFSSLGALDGNANDYNYVDALLMDTWVDTGGGVANAIVARKNTPELWHYWGDHGANVWSGKKQIAYTDSSVASATKAASVADYNDTTKAIQVGYAGASLTADEATYVACYTAGGGKIKDCKFETLKTKMGLDNAATKEYVKILNPEADGTIYWKTMFNEDGFAAISHDDDGDSYAKITGGPGYNLPMLSTYNSYDDEGINIGAFYIKHNCENYQYLEISSVCSGAKNVNDNVSGIRFDSTPGGEGVPTICPVNNGRTFLGTSGYKFNCVYAQNGTIQTSDRTKKDNIFPLSNEQTRDFIMSLIPSSYTMKDGTSGRTHYGLIAQDVEDAMKALGMESTDFAGFIKSPRTAPDFIDEKTGKVKRSNEVMEGEFDYSLRYDEFIAPLIKMVQMQQQELDSLCSEVAKLKEKISG